MRTLLVLALVALTIVSSSRAAEPAVPASLKEVQATLKKELMAVENLYLTKLKPKTHADRIYGNGVKWVEVLADPETMEIATGTVNSTLMGSKKKFIEVVSALERGRNNAKLLGTVEGNKLAGAIDSVLKIVAELQKNPIANSRDWPAKAKDLAVYLQ
jgi:hypothetical protein